jgi:hypothetical protein
MTNVGNRGELEWVGWTPPKEALEIWLHLFRMNGHFFGSFLLSVITTSTTLNFWKINK